jgi:hypothetical protein
VRFKENPFKRGHMARRKSRKKTRRSKYKSAFNVRAAGMAYASLALSTNAILRVSPLQFFTAGYMDNSGANTAMSQPGAVTLKEILSGSHLIGQYASRASGSDPYYVGTGSHGGQGTIGQTIKGNLMENGIPLLLSQIGLVATDKIAQNFGVYRSFNKVVRSIGMGNLVKA